MIPPKRFDISPPCLGDAEKVLMRSDFSLNKVVYFIVILSRSVSLLYSIPGSSLAFLGAEGAYMKATVLVCVD